MNKAKMESDQEAELSPIAQKVQSKLRALIIGSSLFMILGIMAVFVAIIYKISEQGSPLEESNFLAASIDLGSNVEIVSVQVELGNLFVLVRDESGTSLLQVDGSTGEIVNRTVFLGQ